MKGGGWEFRRELQYSCCVDSKLVVRCENTCFHRWGYFFLPHFIADIGGCHKREDRSIL